jgi:hypothetical protein
MYRHAPWVTSHLRTFYAGLFKRIKLSDLLYDGNFIPCSADFAMMYPMLEMAAERSKFIPDVLYVYNRQNPISYFRIAQEDTSFLEIFIRGKKKYKRLEGSDITKSVKKKQGVDCIILSEDSPHKLLAFLKSAVSNLRSTGQVVVMYTASSDENYQDYQKVINKVFGLQFIQYHEHTFKDTLLQTLGSFGSDHVLLARDAGTVIDAIDLAECAQKLESSQAHGFYLTLGKNIKNNTALTREQQLPPHVFIGDDVYAWQFVRGEHSWRMPNSLSFSLYKKLEVYSQLKELNFDSVATLEQVWSKTMIKEDALGLFYGTLKVVLGK